MVRRSCIFAVSFLAVSFFAAALYAFRDPAGKIYPAITMPAERADRRAK